MDSLWCALGVVGFIRGRWAHSDAPSALFGSFGDVVLVRVRSGGHWVHLYAPRVLLGIFRVVRLISVRPWGRWVHLGYRGCR